MNAEISEEMIERGMHDMTGECQFCHQLRTVWVSDPAEYSEEDLNKIATSECDCPGAEKAGKRDALVSSGQEAVRLTLTNRHRGHAAEIMNAGLKALCSGRIKKISVQIDKETTATMYLAKVEKDTRVMVECRTTVLEWSDGEQDE